MKRKKLSEMVRYGITGVVTLCFNLFSYEFFKFFFRYQIANVISLIFTKLLAYLLNRRFVFKSKTSSQERLWEFGRFMAARIGTGIIDFVGQILLVEIVSMNDSIAKLIMVVISTILNYLFCSKLVFKIH